MKLRLRKLADWALGIGHWPLRFQREKSASLFINGQISMTKLYQHRFRGEEELGNALSV
jgi:hypothetical protein